MAALYAEVFAWQILQASEKHAELLCPQGTRILFNKPSKACPVQAGTITLKAKLGDLPKLLHSQFTLESQEEGFPYVSVLDREGNLIWLYF
ncbi:MAG: hypothetical protein AAF518_12950 [Spirochaetota bacterium]